MSTAADAILSRLELQLHQSQRNLRLYFAIGGGLLGLGLLSGLGSQLTGFMYSASDLQIPAFLAGSLCGFYCGSLLLHLAMPLATAHVNSLLIEGLLLLPLLDSPDAEIPGQRMRRGLLSPPPRASGSMAGRLDWIVNNWSVIIHRMGYRPLPPELSRLHLLYLVLIVGVPVCAVLLHNVLLLLVLGSVYVLGLGLDALECDAVRRVLLETLRG